MAIGTSAQKQKMTRVEDPGTPKEFVPGKGLSRNDVITAYLVGSLINLLCSAIYVLTFI